MVNTSKVSFMTLVKNNFLNWEFVMGVVLPVVFFTVLDKQGKTLEGTFVAGVWSIGVVGLEYFKTKQVNVFAVISAIFAAIGLIGTYLSHDPKFYLASPIVIDVLLAVVFVGSLFMKKPLILILAEKSMKGKFPEELMSDRRFKHSWFLLSLAWGVLSLSQAGVRIFLLYTVPMNVYFAVSSTYGNVSTPLLILFSFWFPGWYWKRGKEKIA